MRELTAKQRLFVSEYLIDTNATQACIRAGYSAKTANVIGPELLSKTLVSEAIQRLLEQRRKRLEAVTDYGLIEAMRDARGAYEVSREKGNGGAMTAAATLMAKLYGLLIERREVRTGPLDGLSTEDLRQIRVITQAHQVIAPAPHDETVSTH